MNRSHNANSGQDGFTLVECIIAMIITVVGVLAVASLMDAGMRLQVESRDATAANAFARAKVEQLQNSSPESSERDAGGSTTSDAIGYNDTPDARYHRRWLIENAGSGVPENTQRITVVVVANAPGVRLPPVEITTLMRASEYGE